MIRFLVIVVATCLASASQAGDLEQAQKKKFPSAEILGGGAQDNGTRDGAPDAVSVMTRDAVSSKPPAGADTFRLIHAIGNTEREIARGLPKGECERRKRDHIFIAEALGIHSERLGIGSITCLPESVFTE